VRHVSTKYNKAYKSGERTTNMNKMVTRQCNLSAHQPTDKELFVPNADFLKQHFFHEGRLTEAQALCILQKATTLLSREPSLVNVESPVTSECASLDRKWACERNHSKHAAISMGNTCVIDGFYPMRALTRSGMRIV